MKARKVWMAGMNEYEGGLIDLDETVTTFIDPCEEYYHPVDGGSWEWKMFALLELEG